MVKLRGMDVQNKLVGDIQRGKGAEKTAKVVESRGGDIKPRVDIKTEVETYGSGFDGKGAGQASANQAPRSHGAPVAAGGGVLGFLMAEKGPVGAATAGVEIPPFVEDPSKTQLQDLQRFKGMNLKVTVYDPDEYGSLQEANRRGDSIDRRGTLEEVKGDELIMTSNGRTAGLDTDVWKVAKVEVERGPWSYRSEGMGYQDIDEVLLPGAPVQAKMMGNKIVDGALLGTGKDERGNSFVEVVDKAGEKQRLPVSDLYDLTTPGFSFTALTRE